MNCPICKHNNRQSLIKINCGNFDKSLLYKQAIIISCDKCGHIYNKLSNKEYLNLSQYYNREYAPNNLSSKKFGGDRPGSADPRSLKRYKNLFKFLKPYLKSQDKILDGGCATGGFLDFLNKAGFKNLYGIDFTRKYIDIARRNNYKIKLGDVENIPFKNDLFNLVVIDQVLEHLINPNLAFREARRVLLPNGLLCISVPDALKYKENRFFDFYWFLMREHIQHFDLEHLRLLGQLNGFELIDYSREKSSMMSDKMILPTLNVVFRLKSDSSISLYKNFDLKNRIISYINQELRFSRKNKKILSKLILLKKPIYVYGMSREFLYLYELGLKKCNIIGLVDDTIFKQNKFKLGSRKIFGSEDLKNVSNDSTLVITAFAHISILKAKLKRIGYSGSIIDF